MAYKPQSQRAYERGSEPPPDVQRVPTELTAPCFFCGERGPCRHGNKHRVH